MKRHHHQNLGKSRVLWTLLFSALILISACHPALKPKEYPTLDIPTAWRASGEKPSQKISSGWVKDLNDPHLTALISEAMSHNPSILATAQRLEVSEASITRSRANRIPNLNLGSTSSRSRVKGNGNSHTYTGNQRFNLGASWEIDLWGRLKNLHTATEADYQSTLADFRGARLSLASRVASAWYNLITNQNQTKLSEETLASYKKVEKIIGRNYKAGTARSLDLQLSRNNVYNEERTLRSRKRALEDAKRNLEILLGRYPNAALNAPNQLPKINKNIPAGLPSELLNRRPDLVQAQQRVYASFHRAKAAQKNLLPAIRLTGNAAMSSPNLSQLIDLDSLISSISASLTQSIFNGGALRAEAEAAVARNQANIYDFASIALKAFREIESSLAAEQSLNEQEQFQRKSLEQAALAEKQAGRNYAEGIEGTNIIDLLEAQRRASNARNALIILQNQRIQNRINLHLALGGDFFTKSK